MFIFKKVADLQQHLAAKRQQGLSIGFVPTMGALHEGHASLIQQSTTATDITVCSIFVNPTQFNEASDLAKYPRTPEKDIALLLEAGCTVLFMPPVEEVYPDGQRTPVDVDFGYLDQPMEGAHRPGHFGGVAQVVKRLLDIVQPTQLFMGQKDYQQFAIVQHMIAQLGLPVRLVMCATVREADGLAMSSRNMRLSAEQRNLAPLIFQTLQQSSLLLHIRTVDTVRQEALRSLSVPGMEPEYFDIVDGYTLLPVNDPQMHEKVVFCTAVRLGDVRLIDNLVTVGKSR